MPQRDENHALNALRTIAALVVVVGHIRGWLFVPLAHTPDTLGYRIVYAATSLGNGAVLVFFVLSGYFVGGGVIGTVRRNQFSWARFANARLTRLWIVLLPALALTWCLDTIGIHAFPTSVRFDHGSEVVHHSGFLTFVGNAGFTQTSLVPTFGSNGSLWSLAYEASYYLLFPVLLLLVLRRGPAWERVAGAVAGAATIAIGGAHVLLLFPVWLLGALIAYY
jgi:peptidoglycan/LPS O-acetylase OafA/YrhL